LDFLEAKLESF